MKITFVLPVVGMSGGIRVIAIYANKLEEMGHDVLLVSPAPQRETYRSRLKSLLTGGGWKKYTPYIASHLDGFKLNHKVLNHSGPVSNKDLPDADAVIATWWETAEWVYDLSRTKGAKIYFVQGHEVFQHLPIERVKKTYLLPMKKIVISNWLNNIMRVNYHDQNAVLILNSVDTHQFNAPERGKQDIPTIGFLYSDAEVKGVDVTLVAIKKLYEIFPKLKVISFGSTVPDRDDNWLDSIEFHHLPPQQEIRELYARCDVWITSSRNEGFNLTAMEAMACRVPVVSTNVGWPEEAIRANHNGVLVQVNDVQGIVSGAESLLKLSDVEWRELSRNAYKTAVSGSWDISAEQFEKTLINEMKEQRSA